MKTETIPKIIKVVLLVLVLLIPILYFISVRPGNFGSREVPSGNPHSGPADINGAANRNNDGESLKKPRKVKDSASDAYAREAFLYLSRGDYAKASETIEKGCSLYPSDPQLLEIKGRIAYQEGRLKDAAGILEKLTETNPDYAPAYNTLALVCIENEKPGEGLPLVEKAISISPSEVSFKVTRAKILEHLGKSEESDSEYQKIIRENPESYLVYKDWALLHYNLGDRKKAIKILEESISKCKNEEDLIEMYTVKIDSTIDLLDYIEDDNADEARKTVKYVINSVEEDVRKMKQSGLSRRGFYSDLTNMYHTAALHCPEKRDLLNEKAKKYARKYIDESPPPASPDKYHIMGDAYQYLGEYDKAMACYDKAMVGEYAHSVYINVAEVHIARKNYTAAREYLNKIINLKENHYDKKEAVIMLKKIKDKK